MDRSCPVVKECLADALIRLLAQKPMRDITIDALVKEAGVGRNTYFRHFQDKQELLVYKLSILWERWAVAHHVTKVHVFALENCKTFFEWFYSCRSVLELLDETELMPVIYAALIHIIPLDEDATLKLQYAYTCYYHGIAAIIVTWICRGYQESFAEMEYLIKEIFQNQYGMYP